MKHDWISSVGIQATKSAIRTDGEESVIQTRHSSSFTHVPTCYSHPCL